jgi:hypothetical protein
VAVIREDRRLLPAIGSGCNNVGAMNPRSSTTHQAKPPTEPKLKSGLPGTPEEQQRDLRAAMKKHAETLRRLAQ